MTQKHTIDKLANSAILLLASRVSALLVTGLTSWILINVSDMKSDISGLIAEFHGQDARITNLETWRNNFNWDAAAAEKTSAVRKKQH